MINTLSIALAERTEIGAYADFVTGAPAPVRTALGIASRDIGAAQALVIREDPSHFFNRAGGFGEATEVTVDALTAVLDFYREQGVRQGSVGIAPPLLPPDWDRIAGRLGLTEGSRFVKLACEAGAVTEPDGAAPLDAGLRVAPVEPHQAREWAEAMMGTFGFEGPAMVEMTASCVGRPGWRQYAVLEGERIVAVGSVFVHGEYADMFGGATLPAARGRGAQTALLLARARAAQDAGCRWLVAETGAEEAGGHNTSLHNMRRLGFHPLYERVNWRWHREL